LIPSETSYVARTPTPYGITLMLPKESESTPTDQKFWVNPPARSPQNRCCSPAGSSSAPARLSHAQPRSLVCSSVLGLRQFQQHPRRERHGDAQAVAFSRAILSALDGSPGRTPAMGALWLRRLWGLPKSQDVDAAKAPSNPLGRNERRPRAEEEVENEVAATRHVLDGIGHARALATERKPGADCSLREHASPSIGSIPTSST
jgi:hypothetical protein